MPQDATQAHNRWRTVDEILTQQARSTKDTWLVDVGSHLNRNEGRENKGVQRVVKRDQEQRRRHATVICVEWQDKIMSETIDLISIVIIGNKNEIIVIKNNRSFFQ